MSVTEPAAYVDASGLVKLILVEPETTPLVRYLSRFSLFSNEIAITEVIRAVMRFRESWLDDALAVIDGLLLIPATGALLRSAGTLRPVGLRSLDAIHVASALSLGAELDVLVTYDVRMRGAAEHAGLHVESPGAG